MKLERFLQHWWFKEYQVSVEGLGLYRIAYVLFVLFIYGLPDFSWIGSQPDYYYLPRMFSVGALFQEFPSSNVFFALQLIIALGYALLLVGWKTRVVSYAVPIAVLVCKTFSYAFGHLDHDIFAWIVPLVFAGSGWGNAYSVDAWQNRNRPIPPTTGWSGHMLAFLLSMAMFTSVLAKIIGGWLILDNQAVEAHFAYNYYVVGRHDLLATPFLGIKSAFFWEFMDWTAVLFEFSFILLMWRRRLFRALIGVACIFHFLNMVMLNIPFTENIGAYLAFISWDWVKNKIPNIPLQFPPNTIAISIVFCGLCAIPSWARQPEIRPLWMDAVELSIIGLIGVLIVGTFLVNTIRQNLGSGNFAK
ncbi:MAG: hypothetical protein GC205_09835 [Bacteroidetes bacterium]|nr:hypothetical protein [Bacteroidota bacterium]